MTTRMKFLPVSVIENEIDAIQELFNVDNPKCYLVEDKDLFKLKSKLKWLQKYYKRALMFYKNTFNNDITIL